MELRPIPGPRLPNKTSHRGLPAEKVVLDMAEAAAEEETRRAPEPPLSVAKDKLSEAVQQLWEVRHLLKMIEIAADKAVDIEFEATNAKDEDYANAILVVHAILVVSRLALASAQRVSDFIEEAEYEMRTT